MGRHHAGRHKNANLDLSWRRLAAAAALAALASCGGGDATDDTSSAAKASRPSERAQALPPGTTIPADARIKGMWSPVYDWPLVAVHTVLMPDGRVLSYGTDTTGRQTGNFVYDVWDGTGLPSAGHLTLPNGSAVDIFCSSQLVLPEPGANVLIVGGDNWTGTGTTNTGNPSTTVFSGTANSLAKTSNLNRPRWYSSSTTLINGETYIQGGAGGTDRPEIRGRDGTFRLLANTNTSGLDFQYPRNFVAPDGRVFGFDSAGRMYYVNTDSGVLASVGNLPGANTGSDGSAAMFRPGRILQFGGNSNGAVVIDITGGGTPVVTPTQSMSSQRRLVNGTLLADGQVLASGGSQVWNEMTGVNNIAEIWNPTTGQWLQGAVGAKARLYHGNALLLPDASVLITGGGAPGPLNNLNAEIYYPPYLFNAAGQEAQRPAITTTPDFLEIGRTFTLGTSSAGGVSRVTLVKTGSTTHSWNMDQRFIELSFKASGDTLAVQAPVKAGDAPPGYYMLFVFDAAGVPSVAKILFLGVAANPNPQLVPTLASPGNRTTLVGESVDVGLTAADPNGDTLSYTAAGLPPGVSLDGATGRLTGAASATGSYNVVLSVSDGVNSASVNLVWQVNAATGLTVGSVGAPVASLANGSASFSASAAGANVRYQWNFGDGSPVTAWSSSGAASHVYTRAGSFLVTLSVTDDSGQVLVRSFQQTVYLPATANRPTASSNLLLHTPASGNARLWVVNPDNDSVSVFDAVTRAKLAEVAVGTAPRSLALAPNGLVWVVNRQAATVTVINATTFAVSRTLALPRASQPFGIAMSPTAAQAFVATEAGGQLLKFDTGTYAQTGALAIGTGSRHVSVSGDGASVYVSRFITPPLPGEGTAVVAPTATTGGELRQVNAATMALTRTLILANSTKPDFENQGRGIPNYLGAAAISPDGSQAFVPSKQDNVQRGTRRDGQALNFQNTVRAVSSRVNLATGAEDLAGRIDHDNASLASAAAFDPRGVYLFVALETSREVAVLDAHSRAQLLRIDTGFAPQGLAVAPDGSTLYVHNFMSRSVGVYDLRRLLQQGQLDVPLTATLASVGTEKLGAQVLLGKQLFYDARDPRLARDRYMSCASCHNDGGHDGRTWDLTSQGEGLRNTASLRGRAGAQGWLHWSANFDEVQDFEGQIRTLAGGTGLMPDASFNAGTRSQPLGDRKAGLAPELDALAAYVGSLATFDNAPGRTTTGALTSAAASGKTLFQSLNCASCHAGAAFSGSGFGAGVNIGTIKATSGSRLGGALTGIDIPTLRDVWATAPYLHDGSAATLELAVRAHSGVSITDANLANLVAYLQQIGAEEATAPQAAGSGTGLTGRYYRGTTPLSGSVRLTRTQAVDFNWGTGSPSSTYVGSDNFSARWTGTVQAPATGSYRFQTQSDDGVRLWVNGVAMVNNWTDHGSTADTGPVVNLVAGQRYSLTLEYYEKGGSAEMRLRWQPPGAAAFVAVPRDRLFPN